jgi:hypothetical protein
LPISRNNPNMSERPEIPQAGDRVRLNNTGPVFVIVAVDPDRRTASLVLESEMEAAGFDEIYPVDDPETGSSRKDPNRVN